MNRQQRRAAERAKPSYLRVPADQRMARLMKQGISPDDLKKEWDDGFKAGYEQACMATVKTCYAAALLAMRQVLHFGRKRGVRVLKAMDEIVIYSLSGQDEIDKVYDEMHITLSFKGDIGGHIEED